MFQEGRQLGEYTLVRKLGAGGFGEVWLAASAGRYFALKFPHRDQVDWKAITQEIGIWTLCGRHPNVVPLIGAKNFDGQIVIISEYVPDGSLEDLLKQKGALAVEEAVKMTSGILQGLQHLHASGIVHSDLKPANILLDGKRPRLTDFGISRASKHTNTLSQTIAGTLKYMAPECFDGKRNVQTDVWAVGVILYQMLTGRLPYQEEETVQLIASVVLKEPRPLPDWVPPSLKNIIGAALAKDAAQRFQTAEQMRQNLLAISAGELNLKGVETGAGNTGPQTSPPTLGGQSVQTSQLKQPTAAAEKSKRFRPLMIVAGALSVLFLLLAGLGSAGVYYYVKTGPIFVSPTPTPPFYRPTPSPTPTPFREEFYETDGKIDEVLDLIEQRAGGKLKIVNLGLYSNTLHYLNAAIQDPNVPENYDTYFYKDGTLEKTPYKWAGSRPPQPFSRSDVNWRAIPNLVKIAKERTKDLEGMEKPYVFVYVSERKVKIMVSISGKRKDLRLTASANGDVEKIEVK